MMNILKKPIDYEGLEEELEKALREDTLHELRNSAKLRAVEQRVPTYEHFRQMVNAAHLKPLEVKDKMEKAKIPWNRESKNLSFGNFYEEKNLGGCDKAFKSGREFFCKFGEYGNDKFDVLYDNRVKLREMFKIELPSDVLGEILSVCKENLSAKGNADKIVEILQEISECRRFQLTATFMSASDKSTCEELFSRLISAGSSVDELVDKFNINLN